MKTFLSVVVCTYNRADLLATCLKSLAEQTGDRNLYEVIVVNNNSVDNTEEVAQEYSLKNRIFRLVRETRQGLSHSRNLGWQEAAGSYVAYIDDDAKANADWVQKIIDFITRCPEAGAFGGPYEAFSTSQIPVWVPPDCGTWGLGTKERPINIGSEWINGTNMIFKKDLLKRFGGFNAKLGMKGKRISYGEETRLLLEMKKNSIPVYYVPDIIVKHLLADYKMSLKWLLKSCYANGRCSAETFNTRRTFMSHLFGLCISGLRAFTVLFPLERMPFKRRLYFAFSGFFAELGSVAEYFGGLNREH